MLNTSYKMYFFNIQIKMSRTLDSIEVNNITSTNVISNSNAVQLQGEDISVTTPLDTQVLAYNLANSRWEPTAAGGGGANATQLQGVNISVTSPLDTQVLTYNSGSSQWEPTVGGGGGISLGNYNLYWNGVNGNDLLDGTTLGNAVLTWARVEELANSLFYQTLTINMVSVGAFDNTFVYQPDLTPIPKGSLSQLIGYTYEDSMKLNIGPSENIIYKGIDNIPEQTFAATAVNTGCSYIGGDSLRNLVKFNLGANVNYGAQDLVMIRFVNTTNSAEYWMPMAYETVVGQPVIFGVYNSFDSSIFDGLGAGTLYLYNHGSPNNHVKFLDSVKSPLLDINTTNITIDNVFIEASILNSLSSGKCLITVQNSVISALGSIGISWNFLNTRLDGLMINGFANGDISLYQCNTWGSSGYFYNTTIKIDYSECALDGLTGENTNIYILNSLCFNTDVRLANIYVSNTDFYGSNTFTECNVTCTTGIYVYFKFVQSTGYIAPSFNCIKTVLHCGDLNIQAKDSYIIANSPYGVNTYNGAGTQLINLTASNVNIDRIFFNVNDINNISLLNLEGSTYTGFSIIINTVPSTYSVTGLLLKNSKIVLNQGILSTSFNSGGPVYNLKNGSSLSMRSFYSPANAGAGGIQKLGTSAATGVTNAVAVLGGTTEQTSVYSY